MKHKRRNSNLTFKIYNKIGAGCFGEVYNGECLQTGEKVAIKKEPIGLHSPQLFSEMKVIKTLNNPNGFPLFRGYWSEEGYHALAETLLGKNLSDIFHSCGHIFPIKTVYMLADQMISRLEFLHNKDIIHRDIKPENFLIGRGKNSNVIYLVDFGLSKFYRDPISHIHIPYREGKPLVGTARYVSLNIHNGIEPSRRDDLESLAYLLIYFAKGKLPWQRFLTNDKCTKRRLIHEKKQSISIDLLCEGLPPEFAIFLESTRKLDFEEVPYYSNYKNLFRSALIRMGECYDHNFSWVRPKSGQLTNLKATNNNQLDDQTSNKPNQSQAQYPTRIHCLMADKSRFGPHNFLPRSLDRHNFNHHLTLTVSRPNNTAQNKNLKHTPVLSNPNSTPNKTNNITTCNFSNGKSAIIRKSCSDFSNIENFSIIRENKDNFNNNNQAVSRSCDSELTKSNVNNNTEPLQTKSPNINNIVKIDNSHSNVNIQYESNLPSSSSNSNYGNKVSIRKSSSDFNDISNHIDAFNNIHQENINNFNIANSTNNILGNDANNKNSNSNVSNNTVIINNNANSKANIRKCNSDFANITDNILFKKSSSDFDNDNQNLCSCCNSEFSRHDNDTNYLNNNNFNNVNNMTDDNGTTNVKNKISSSHSNINFYNINFTFNNNDDNTNTTPTKNIKLENQHRITLNETLFARYQSQYNPVTIHKGTPFLVKPAVSQSINIDKYTSNELQKFGVNNLPVQTEQNQVQQSQNDLQIQFEKSQNQFHNQTEQKQQPDNQKQEQKQQQQNNQNQEHRSTKRPANIKHSKSHHIRHHHHEDDYIEQFELLHVKKATPSLWGQNLAFLSKNLI